MFSENLRLKLRYILWPFVRLLALFNCAVAGVFAVVLQWYPLFKIPDGIGTYVGTMAVTFAVVLLLESCFLLIRDKTPKRNGASSLPFLTAVFTFGFAAYTLPRYVIAKTGHLQPVPTLAALPRYPAAPYYQVPHVMLDTLHKQLYPFTYESGGKSSHQAFELLVVCPVVSKMPLSSPDAATVWLAFGYYGRTDTPDFRSNYWPAYQRFIASKKQAFWHNFQRPCYYFERLPDDDWIGKPDATGGNGVWLLPGAATARVILRPVYTPFTQRTGHFGPFWVWSQVIGISLFCLLSCVLPLDEVRKQKLLAAESSF